MKQHITERDYDLLSTEGKIKLAEYLAPKHIQEPLLSIGQMIDFLQTYKTDKRFKNGYPTYIDFYQDGDDYDWWRIKPDTLCDDLWEAVKQVLEGSK